MAPILLGLEEHFTGKAVVEAHATTTIPNHMFPKSVVDNLIDLGGSRIRNMDKGNMSIQVISHTPTVESPELCRAANDQLFEAIDSSGGRYRGFAFLPMENPEAIPAELERCVKELGFVGALVPNHAHGRYYDAKAFWPMFEMAQELDVPIYLHPAPTDDFERFSGNYDKLVQTLISGPALCWHTDVAMHMLRLYGSGVFDAYPCVKIILGHNGEAVPFMLDRIDKMFSRRWGSPKRDWMTVWNENVWITTSGMFHLGPLQCCLNMCQPDRVMYSGFPASSVFLLIPQRRTSADVSTMNPGLDYPFEDPQEGLEFMEAFEKVGLVSPEQFEMICSGNAKNLLRI